FVTTYTERLSRAQTISETHASPMPKDRVGDPPRASTTARPREAMRSVPLLVVTKATKRPSGDHWGIVFMPGRSTTGRGGPGVTFTAKSRVWYCAAKPETGAAEYTISTPSGDQEKLSTYWSDGVSGRATEPSGGKAQRRAAGSGAPARMTKELSLRRFSSSAGAGFLDR